MYSVALEILNILSKNGYKSYIIGGFCRNRILGIESNDIDIITSAKPNEIRNIFHIDTNSQYGSIKLLYKEFIFDITTFRKENKYIDNRWPKKVKFVKSLKKDLKRRDFTINTICIDKNGNYIDLLNGIKDLNNRLIKTVGNPNTKIKEDSLRILRALRFSCLYDLNFDKKLEESIVRNKNLISNLSFDRIKNELDIIFNSEKCIYFFNTIDELNLYEVLKISCKNNIIPTGNNLSIWAQLNYSNEYRFSNKDKKIIDEIREIINLSYIDSYIIYKYNMISVIEAAKILNIKIDYKNEYDKLIIHSRKDIDICHNDINNLGNNININKIYIDLEKQILYNNLNNKKRDIISYIVKCGDTFE